MKNMNLVFFKCIKFFVTSSLVFTCFDSTGIMSMNTFASSNQGRQVTSSLVETEEGANPTPQNEIVPDDTEGALVEPPVVNEVPLENEAKQGEIGTVPTQEPVNLAMEPVATPDNSSPNEEQQNIEETDLESGIEPTVSPSVEPIEEPSGAIMYGALRTSNVSIPVMIVDENGETIENTVSFINAGEILSNVPAIDGYTFIKASINGVGVTGTGEYDGLLYYSTDSISTLQFENKVLMLNYEKTATDYAIDYQYNSAGGLVTGDTSVSIGMVANFEVQPNKGYEVAKVFNNGEEIAINQEGLYSITPNQDTTVTVEFKKVEYSISYYAEGNRNSNASNPVSVKHGETLTFVIEFGAGYGLFDSQCLLKNLTINGVQLEIPSKNHAEVEFSNREILGLNVSMAYKYSNTSTKLTFTISGISDDLSIGYNIVDSSKGQTRITIGNLDGVTLYHYTKSAQSAGGSLETVRSGQTIFKNDGIDAFFIAPKPGYTTSIIGGEDATNLSEIGVNKYYGDDQAKALNAVKEFGFSKFHGQPKNRIVTLSSSPINYSASLYFGEGDSPNKTEKNLTINGTNSFKLTGPTTEEMKTGYTFEGYKIGDKTYNVNDTFTIDTTTVGLANENNTFVFVGIWKKTTITEEEMKVPYSIDFYFQEKIDSDSYILDESRRITTYGDKDALAFYIPIEIKGYAPNVEKNSISTSGKINNSTSSTTLKVYYDIKTSTITFNLDGGNVNGELGAITIKGKVDDEIDQNLIPTPEKEGYTLAGWSPEIPTHFGSNNESFTALWTDTKLVDFKYHLTEGGTISNTSETVNYIVGKPKGSKATANEGYAFIGWAKDSEGKEIISSDETFIPSKNVNDEFEGGEYYAIFKEISVTLTFKLDGGNINGSTEDVKISGRLGTKVSIDEPKKPGFTFVRWSPEIPTHFGSDNESFTALWTDTKLVDFKYHLTEGGTISNTSETVNYIVGEPKGSEATANEGYAFIGWAKDSEGKEIVSSDETFIPSKNVNDEFEGGEYYAIFEEISVTLTFKLDGGNINGSTEDVKISGRLGAKVSIDEPKKPGFTFVRWSPEIPTHFGSDNESFTALWTDTKLVDFNYHLTEGGTISNTSETVNYIVGKPKGSEATVNEGYAFIGWAKDSEGKEIVSSDETFIPSKNANGEFEGGEYYAIFEERLTTIHSTIEVVAVSGDLNTTEFDETILAVSGEASKFRVPTEIDALDFDGVYVNVEGNEGTDRVLLSNNPNYKPLRDENTGFYEVTEFVVVYKEKTADLSYAALEGGSVSLALESIGRVWGQPSGSTARADEGYSFVGWTKNEDGSGPYVSTELTFIPTNQGTEGIYFENTNYVAVFSRNPVPPTPTQAPANPVAPVEEVQVDEPVAAVVPVVNQPVVNVPEEVIIEEETPEIAPQPTPIVEEIQEEVTPEVIGRNSWALINLLATLLTVLMAVYYGIKNKKEEDDSTTKSGKMGKALSIMAAGGSIILFILTENMSNPMILADRWTLAMILIALVEVGVLVVTNKQEDKQSTVH